ncbi:MAG TPA: glycogen debranching N-terminal domain-containing protein [Ktedonobacterales bacterium]|nr:glycogen debranching N-terminal domain-containing protein [Ktedonobacterales bacterium]
MAGNTVSILEGNTFVVSDLRGDIDATPTDTTGLFAFDTRYLSRWRLTIDGTTPNSLSTDDLQYFSAQFFLVPGTGTIYVDADLSIIRKRAVGNGFHEDLIILNHSAKAVDLEVKIEAGSDFADLFEVKDKLAKKGEFYTTVTDGRLVLGYRRETYERETWITSSVPAEIANTDTNTPTLTYHAHIEPHEQWNTGLDISLGKIFKGIGYPTAKYHSAEEHAQPDMRKGLDDWIADAPRLVCEWETLTDTYKRSLVDLAALRFFPMGVPGAALPAAGLPWFMTVFGRDSVLTSLQALPFAPDLAESTLRTLAGRQGRRVDDFRDEEPGKIMHEQRFGEMTAFLERPHSPYYGSADVTPLFLVLLDEYERWTGDIELVRRLEPNARQALEWIDNYGDRNGDGYIEYARRNEETGLENQCWKDSWNSIVFADGTLSKLPRATCEIQGYAYDAKVRCARLAREIWGDHTLAERLDREAVELKLRFNRDYWIPDRKFFALAIDGDGRQVDSLTSNIGHLLWSGIADDEKAADCVQHLMSDKLFSGWGIRTMAEGEGAYNPIGYHVGTVWPFDNSFIALGLRRYGYRDEAARVGYGILEAAQFFRGRLPEAFGGYRRGRTQFPVEYPTACSPQAWSTGAPLLILRALLGLEPIADRLLVDPALPTEIAEIQLLDIPGRWGHVDAFGRGRIDLAKLNISAPEPEEARFAVAGQW